MNKMKNKSALYILVVLILITASLSFVSALTISEVSMPNLTPGDEKALSVKVKNNLGEDVSDVSMNLAFAGKPFIPVGSSEDQVDEILDDKSETFKFKIKASNDVKPGDYELPYALSYKDDKNNLKQKTGTIGFSVIGDSEMDFVLLKDNPIVGQKGKVALKIINKGFGAAKFVSVKAIPTDYDLLSEDKIYIGNINSDDFETASFDVIFKNENGIFSAVVEYSDFDNQKITKNINLLLNAYTTQKAIELGIIKKSNTAVYVSVIIILFIIWLIYRSWKKRARLRKAREANGRN
jgi:hypothetical protein